MKMRKLVAMLMAVMMLCCIIPFSAAAEGTSAVIDFTDKANRTAYSTEQQVWEQNGIIITNNKGASTSNVGDYGGDGYPARFYKSSTVIIEYPGMTKLVIDCHGLESKYVSGWADSAVGATATVDGTTVTIVFPAAVDSFTWETLTAQSRAYSITVYTGDAGDAPVEPPVTPDEPSTDPEADTELSISDAIALGTSKEHNAYTEGKYYVTGVITEVYNTTYGNMYITDDAGNKLTIYGTYSADGSARYDALDVKPVAGDTVKIYGIVGQYNGTAQIKNGWIVEHTPGETPDVPVDPPVTPDEPAATVVTNPVAGVAYKLGLDQTQKGAIYYFVGKMSNYYGATETDIALAVDMYLENADGGYKMYFNDANGGKQYIHLVQSGTHYNFTFGAEASVFTWDAERNALYAPCGDQICYMGTYGSYVTVGTLTTAKLKDTDYIARLYAVGESTDCEHEYEFECSTTCQLCGKGEREAVCVNNAPLCQDGLCIYCDNDVDGLGHAYDNDSDADCNYCGEEREIGGGSATAGGSADFNTIVTSNANGDSGYKNTYTTTNGWVTENSAIQCGGSAVSNPQFPVIGADNTFKAVCMNGKVSAPGKITSPTLNGGISKLTLTYTKMFTDTKLSATVTITDLTNGTVYTHTVARDVEKDTDKYVVWTDEWVLDTPITGDFTIVMVNDCPSGQDGNKDRFTVLGIEWAAEGGDTPVEPPVSGDPEADTELSIADAIALGASKEHNAYTEGKYYVTGVITEVYNTQYGNMKIKDDAGNILTIYGTYSADGSTRYDALEVKPVVGDTVKIYGIIGQYNGTPQIKNGWIVEHTPGDTPVEPPVSDDPAADTELSISDAIALGASKEHNTYTEGKYYVTGVITEVYNTQYGNMKIKDEAGNILTIYGTYSADGEIRYDALEVKPVAGDTVKIYGIIGQYNGTPQVKNGWIVEHTGGDVPPVEPPVSDDPAADTELSISDAIALGASKEHNTYTEGKYYVTGVITEVYNTTYGNMKIKDEAGNILTIYGTYSADGEIRYDALEVKPVAGDTVKIYGIIGQYNGTPQIKNGWIVEHIPGGDVPPVDPPVVPDEGSAIIDFTDIANRVSYSTEQQVWQQNGITITNNKGASTSNVGDYGGNGYPARFYKSSTVIIEYPGMTKLVIDCAGLESKYVNGWADSAVGATATVDGTIVTIEFAAPVDSFTWETLSAQSRANSITVYAEETPDVPADPTDIVVSTTEGQAGDTVTVTVSLPENPGIISAKVKVYYDTAILKLIGYEAGSFSASGYSWGQLDKDFFIINWCDGTGADSTADLLATLTFEILEGAAEGFTAITVEFSCENDMFNAAGETVLFDGVNGGVQVVAPAAPEYLPGDANGDGRVNNKDLGLIQQYLADFDVTISNMNAFDVNGDGRVNNKDLGLIQQYLADFDVELKYGAIAE